MSRPRVLLLAVLLLGTALAGCVNQDPGQSGDTNDPSTDPAADGGVDQGGESSDAGGGQATTPTGTVTVEQGEGDLVYWVLPGPRTLGEGSWGTPEHPKSTLVERLDDLRELPAPYNETVLELVQKVPIIAGLPMEARATNEDNTSFTHTKMGTPVSDKGRIVEGSFSVTYEDRTPWDLPTKFDAPSDTPDSVDATASFSDPQGNTYELHVDRLRQWSFQENGGGVVTNGFIHGTTGIDSPLFPRAFTYGAFWGVGDVVVNGEVVNEDQWIHFMTTQTVRDDDYKLATLDQLPLPLDETIAGQPHHTHIVVRPVMATPDGPVFSPVKTNFTLPNGKTQPFIHAMFEQDRILTGPFQDDPSDPWMQASSGPGSQTEAEVTVTGQEWQLSPSNLTASAGENVTVAFQNIGDVAHNWALDVDGDGEPDHQTPTIQPGETATVSFTVEAPGDHAYFCDVSGHRQAGMQGTLTVTDA